MFKLIVTCEHAGNEVPNKLKSLFHTADKVITTHRGFDIGAHQIYKYLLKSADAHYDFRISRLVIDLNRSLHHPKLFSEFTMTLPKDEKLNLINYLYIPYRTSVENAINHFILKGFAVIHISVHTFTPVWNDTKRNADVGFLYDPIRKAEKEFAKHWKNFLKQKSGNLIVRFNYPYKGVSDGFTKYLRAKLHGKNYIGIELEVNQKFTLQTSSLNDIINDISESLILTLNNFAS
jgi:predicted N-formylglutamate amidohydrolase